MRLANNLLRGDRQALAKAITLIESDLSSDRLLVEEMFSHFPPVSASNRRIGISGPPGVGKSTFIEAFGLLSIEHGFRPAVLAIDPTSPRSGGSILGDKTRMLGLSDNPCAFIRASANRGERGGIGRRMQETISCCEAAGYNLVLIETVGAGQADSLIYDFVDLFMLILMPFCGDDLQAIKRGVMELADLIIINKSDGVLKKGALVSKASIKNSLSLFANPRKDWEKKVFNISAKKNIGIDEVFASSDEFFRSYGAGEINEKRSHQALLSLQREIFFQLQNHIKGLKTAWDIEEKVKEFKILPSTAARLVIDKILSLDLDK